MRNQRGTVILTLLVVILMGGVLATRLIPSIEVQEKRQTDTELKFALSQIRQAFDLKLKSDPTFNPDLSTPGAIASAMASLTTENLLGNNQLRDSTVPAYQWGVNQHYWVGVGNIASNTGFEDDDAATGFLASWSKGTADTTATSEVVAFPDSVDDYKGQNKLGKLFSTLNTTLKLTK